MSKGNEEASALAKELRAIRTEIGGIKSQVNQALEGLAGLRGELIEKREGRAASPFADKYQLSVEVSRESMPGFKARVLGWTVDGNSVYSALPPEWTDTLQHQVVGVGTDPYSALEDFSRCLRGKQALHVAGRTVQAPRSSNLRPEGQ